MQHPETPLNGSAAEIVCDWADSFIGHWQSDEGQDAADQAKANEAASDMERFRPFLVAAASAYTPDIITTMRRQLFTIRSALERARDVLAVAADTHPDTRRGGILSPGCQPEPEGEGIAGDCANAAQEAVEGVWFVNQVLAALPEVLPVPADEAKVIAEARLDVLRGGEAGEP